MNNQPDHADRRNARHNALAGISQALIQSGYKSLDAQARALGLSRSTAWTVIKHHHKLGRLHSTTTAKMLANPALPDQVRAAVEAYLGSATPAPSPAAFLDAPNAKRTKPEAARSELWGG